MGEQIIIPNRFRDTHFSGSIITAFGKAYLGRAATCLHRILAEWVGHQVPLISGQTANQRENRRIREDQSGRQTAG